MTKVPKDERSVYQLLSNMRAGKKDNILKFVTEKTHATLKAKKRFPMFLDHINFFTKVYSHFTFKQEPF